jgi:hypothetical protein
MRQLSLWFNILPKRYFTEKTKWHHPNFHPAPQISRTLNTGTENFSEMLVQFYVIAQHHILQGSYLKVPFCFAAVLHKYPNAIFCTF